jgi:hypothetical protein
VASDTAEHGKVAFLSLDFKAQETGDVIEPHEHAGDFEEW